MAGGHVEQTSHSWAQIGKGEAGLRLGKRGSGEEGWQGSDWEGVAGLRLGRERQGSDWEGRGRAQIGKERQGSDWEGSGRAQIGKERQGSDWEGRGRAQIGKGEVELRLRRGRQSSDGAVGADEVAKDQLW
ncbi:hypothetical protein HHUSO_G13216 [Huso huso]|uniref:Uncharacterized protein n=1 Tax=Huso huso TaxID=61971 RepID=A0ABR0ZKA6_HUSHU